MSDGRTSQSSGLRKRSSLVVDVPSSGGGSPSEPQPPALRRLTTPDCMSSPVSHLRDLTRDLVEDGAKRRRAAQYLRESRESHLQHRRLYLVLDLDETLVHSLRASVRQCSPNGTPATTHASTSPLAMPTATTVLPVPVPAGRDEDDAEFDGGEGESECDDHDGEIVGSESRNPARGFHGHDDHATGPVPSPLDANRNLKDSSPKDSSPKDSSPKDSDEENVASRADASVASASDSKIDQPYIGPLPSGGSAQSSASQGEAVPIACRGSGDQQEVTLRVANVEFEMRLRPGVHEFLREMSSLFCVHMYTMGSREYVQQALHYLDPRHEIFKPGQVLAWNPALDRTTKTLQRLLCVPELVLIVDDSPIAWANHLSNLVLIDRFVGSPEDRSLQRVASRLKAIHKSYFERVFVPVPRSLQAPGSIRLPSTAVVANSVRNAAITLTAVPEGTALSVAAADACLINPRRPKEPRTSQLGRTTPCSPLMMNQSQDAASAPSTSGSPPSPVRATVHDGEGAAGDADDAAEESREDSSLRPTPAKADVRELLLAECGSVLKGIDCTFAGPMSLLIVDGHVPPEVQLARRCGAVISEEITQASTHILVPPALLADGALYCERTLLLLRQARALGCLERLTVVDARWLLDCVARWQRLPMDDYRLPMECLEFPMPVTAHPAWTVPAHVVSTPSAPKAS